MTKRLKHFIKGVGSVVSIAPQANPGRFVQRKPIQDTLQGDLRRVGGDMKRAFDAQSNARDRRRDEP